MNGLINFEYTGQVDNHLLAGCCREADRAELVSYGLDGLRLALPENFHGHLAALIEELRASSRLLRDLADRSQVHYTRVPVLLNYLNIVLPCLSRSLRDITSYYEDRTLSKEIRWRKMYNSMTNEVGGLPLPQRFSMYNHFLTLLRQLLTRSPNFDLNTLDTLKTRIMQLREARSIPPPPVQVGPLVRPDMAMIPNIGDDPTVHWAEQIFSLPLSSRTPLKHIKESRSWGPFLSYGNLKMPANSQILFRRTFDSDKLSLISYMNTMDYNAHFVIRTYHLGGPWFSSRGIHELVVSRHGSSLELKRWSNSMQKPVPWAILYFQTWEEMVLLYCTFVALKARNTFTIHISPDEYKLHSEKRLFQAQIIDDGYKHSLIVYEDQLTKGIRLHAAVWEGELRQCPVWTAFVTHQSASPTWLIRRSKHRVWLKDVQLYVFCQRYRQQNQRQNRASAFEIYFVSEEASKRFQEVFFPPPATPIQTDSSDGVEAVPIVRPPSTRPLSARPPSVRPPSTRPQSTRPGI